NELLPASRVLVEGASGRTERLGIGLTQEIAEAERCVSPSDFGFHNALRAANGTVYFLDFEYAGWDDPPHMLCDFFCQPRWPVAFDFFEEVVTGVGAYFRQPELLRDRAYLLLPVYRLKWCCIILNEFLPVDGRRRQFANTALGEDHKADQLR